MDGYAPLNTLKPVAENIWIVDGPSISFYKIPFTTRMTVIRLKNGDLWLHSPTKITPDLQAEIAHLGPVRHLIAPSWLHYAYIHEWQTAFPEARAYTAPGVMERALKMGVPMRSDEELTDIAAAAWAGQIEQMIVKGRKVFHEAIFYHRSSKTLIFTDFFENIPKRMLPIWFRPFARLLGILAPNAGMPRDMRMTFIKRHDQLRSYVQQMIDWAPERIIFSHGDWYKSDGVKHLKRAFRWLF